MKKRILIPILVLVFLLVTASIVIYAAATPTISVESVVARAGEEAVVKITMKHNPGVIGVGLTVSYDPELTLTGVEDGGILGEFISAPNYKHNPYYLTWSNDTVEEDFHDDGVFAILYFSVPDSEEKRSYDISLSYNNENFEIFNFQTKTVEFRLEPGAVYVNETGETVTDKACFYCGHEHTGWLGWFIKWIHQILFKLFGAK